MGIAKSTVGRAVLVVAAVTTSASAAVPEVKPVAETPIANIGAYVFDTVALAPGGGALIGGTTVEVAGRVPAVFERPARGGAWTGPTPLSGATRVDIGPIVARNLRGDALAVWGSFDGPLVAAVRPAGSGWQPGVAIGAQLPPIRNARTADTIKIALSDGGVARVVVANCASGACRLTELKTAVRRVKWAAGKPRRLPGYGTPTLDWALSSEGHLVAAWIRPAPVAIQAIVQRPRDKAVQRPQVVFAGAPATGPVDVEVGPRGEAAVGWTGGGGTLQTSIRLPSDLAWRGARGLFRNSAATGTRIGLACDGSLVAAWVEPGDTVLASTAAGAGGPFSDADQVFVYGAETKPVSVAATTSGTSAVVTWSRAEQESAGMSIGRLGDPDDPFQGRNQDFGFRESPAPVFASDGFGLVVGAGDDTLRSQEIEPKIPELVQCAR